MIRAIDRLVRKAMMFTVPAAALMIGLCVGIKSAPITKDAYRVAPYESSVLVLASALQSTNALRRIKHGSR